MTPANKSFHALAMAGLNVEERLIVHFELTACNGVPQVALKRVSRFKLRGHRFIVKGVAVAARRFRTIHRQIGLLEQLLLIAAVLRRHRNPDTGADFDAMARQQEWLGDKSRNAGGETDRSGPLIVALSLDDGEFVAARPRQHIGAA